MDSFDERPCPGQYIVSGMRSEVREARERRISAPPHMDIHDAHLRRDGVVAKEGEDQLPDTLPMHAGGDPEPYGSIVREVRRGAEAATSCRAK